MLCSEKSAPIVEGHRSYCNFVKPHESLDGYILVHFANIYLGLGNKKWENLLIQSIRHKKIS